MTNLLLVALGGAIGASARYLSGLAAVRLLGTGFSWGTLFVNVAGSFAMGLLVVWLARRMTGGGEELRLFLGVGLLGGFTTFSAFSLDAFALWERGQGGLAAVYVAASVALSIAGLVAGVALARAVS